MEEGQPPPKLKKPFLRSNSGLVTRQENAAVRRYIPKGGFIKTFEEVTGLPPKARGLSTSKAAGMARYRTYSPVILLFVYEVLGSQAWGPLQSLLHC